MQMERDRDKERGALARVHALLEDRKWHAGHEITHPACGGSEGLRRVRELRQNGAVIEARKRGNGTEREYRMTTFARHLQRPKRRVVSGNGAEDKPDNRVVRSGAHNVVRVLRENEPSPADLPDGVSAGPPTVGPRAFLPTPAMMLSRVSLAREQEKLTWLHLLVADVATVGYTDQRDVERLHESLVRLAVTACSWADALDARAGVVQ